MKLLRLWQLWLKKENGMENNEYKSVLQHVNKGKNSEYKSFVLQHYKLWTRPAAGDCESKQVIHTSNTFWQSTETQFVILLFVQDCYGPFSSSCLSCRPPMLFVQVSKVLKQGQKTFRCQPCSLAWWTYLETDPAREGRCEDPGGRGTVWRSSERGTVWRSYDVM